jgi:hypothetical protein
MFVSFPHLRVSSFCGNGSAASLENLSEWLKQSGQSPEQGERRYARWLFEPTCLKAGQGGCPGPSALPDWVDSTRGPLGSRFGLQMS